jgi:hypothetical protein
MSNQVSSTDRRILISVEELQNYVSNCADGCDNGFDQVVEVCKLALDKDHGEDQYAVAVNSDADKKELFDSILYSHEEIIADEESDWHEFDLSDIDNLFDDLPMVTDDYSPPVEVRIFEKIEGTSKEISRRLKGSSNNPRADRGCSAPGTW